MIITVTLNPAIDKTAAVDTLQPRALNRLASVQRDVGGKGINVSRVIAALGGESTACGFVAGSTGRSILAELKAAGITTDFLELDGETRTNLKLVEPDGALTEINEPGPTATAGDLETLTARLEDYAAPGRWFVLAGSVCPGVPESYYRDLTMRLHARGARVVLDADGPLLRSGIEAVPDIIKPNGYELAQLFGLAADPDNETITQLANRLVERGVKLVAVSMGGDGASFFSGDGAWHADALRVPVRSTVGAGDAMVGAITYGMAGGLPLPQVLALAMATSAAAVTTEGTCPADKDTVEGLQGQVQLSRC